MDSSSQASATEQSEGSQPGAVTNLDIDDDFRSEQDGRPQSANTVTDKKSKRVSERQSRKKKFAVDDELEASEQSIDFRSDNSSQQQPRDGAFKQTADMINENELVLNQNNEGAQDGRKFASTLPPISA